MFTEHCYIEKIILDGLFFLNFSLVIKGSVFPMINFGGLVLQLDKGGSVGIEASLNSAIFKMQPLCIP